MTIGKQMTRDDDDRVMLYNHKKMVIMTQCLRQALTRPVLKRKFNIAKTNLKLNPDHLLHIHQSLQFNQIEVKRLKRKTKDLKKFQFKN